MKIFIINGNAACGKTTFGSFTNEVLEREGVPFLHESSVSPVKNYLKEVGWEGNKWDGITKDHYWRKTMHECKCWMIENDKHVFDKYALEKLDEKGGVLFYDIREPENISQLIDYCKENREDVEVKSVFVERDMGKQEFDNYADKNQGNYEYDIYVDNCGDLNDLYKETEKFVNENILKDWKEEHKREYNVG